MHKKLYTSYFALNILRSGKYSENIFFYIYIKISSESPVLTFVVRLYLQKKKDFNMNFMCSR